MYINEIEISTQPVTSIRRKARRFETITHEDGELTIRVKVVFLDSNGSDLIETFRGMIGTEQGQISKEQFEALEKKYFPYIVEHTTRKSWVNPVTGDLVSEGTEGAVPEIEWMRSLEVGTHLRPMLFGAGLIAEQEDRHIIIEEAFEKMVMMRMDNMKRY